MNINKRVCVLVLGFLWLKQVRGATRRHDTVLPCSKKRTTMLHNTKTTMKKKKKKKKKQTGKGGLVEMVRGIVWKDEPLSRDIIGAMNISSKAVTDDPNTL